MELIQVRVDSETKAQASQLFESLGLDLSTAIRVFLRKAIIEGGMPFDIKQDRSGQEAIEAMRACQALSKENGNSDLTLDEINEIIAAVRAKRQNKAVD